MLAMSMRLCLYKLLLQATVLCSYWQDMGGARLCLPVRLVSRTRVSSPTPLPSLPACDNALCCLDASQIWPIPLLLLPSSNPHIGLDDTNDEVGRMQLCRLV
ncbi:hypothetical protein V8C44DRAFT_312327 [Trichoderma aethiopicum]